MKAPAAVVMLLVATATALVAQPPSDRRDIPGEGRGFELIAEITERQDLSGQEEDDSGNSLGDPSQALLMSEEDAGKVLFPHAENQEQQAVTERSTEISAGLGDVQFPEGVDVSRHRRRRPLGSPIDPSTLAAIARLQIEAMDPRGHAGLPAAHKKRQDSDEDAEVGIGAGGMPGIGPDGSVDIGSRDTADEDTSSRKRRQLGDLLGGDLGLLGLILKDTKPDIEAVGDRAGAGLPTKHKKRQDEDEGKGAQQDTDLGVSVDTGTDIAGEDATVHERRQLGGLIGGLGSLLGGAKSDVNVLGETPVDAALPAMHKKRQDEGEDAEQGTGPGTDIDVGVGVGVGIDPEARI